MCHFGARPGLPSLRRALCGRSSPTHTKHATQGHPSSQQATATSSTDSRSTAMPTSAALTIRNPALQVLLPDAIPDTLERPQPRISQLEPMDTFWNRMSSLGPHANPSGADGGMLPTGLRPPPLDTLSNRMSNKRPQGNFQATALQGGGVTQLGYFYRIGSLGECQANDPKVL